MKALLLILLIAVSVSAQSVKEGKAINDWTEVIEGQITGKQVKFYWSNETIQRNEDVIKVWLKADFDVPVDIVGQVDGKLVRGISSVREFVIFNCATRSGVGDTEIIYFSSGKVQSREKLGSKNSGKESANTFGSYFANYFCERESQRPSTPPTLRP